MANPGKLPLNGRFSYGADGADERAPSRTGGERAGQQTRCELPIEQILADEHGAVREAGLGRVPSFTPPG